MCKVVHLYHVQYEKYHIYASTHVFCEIEHIMEEKPIMEL